MFGCKPADSLIEANHRLRRGDGKETDMRRYERLIGKFIYLFHTRPDIAYAVKVVSQFMQDPCSTHLEAVYQILRYLKSTLEKGLFFSNNGI